MLPKLQEGADEWEGSKARLRAEVVRILFAGGAGYLGQTHLRFQDVKLSLMSITKAHPRNQSMELEEEATRDMHILNELTSGDSTGSKMTGRIHCKSWLPSTRRVSAGSRVK